MVLLIFRFVVFSAIYCAIVFWWALWEGGMAQWELLLVES